MSLELRTHDNIASVGRESWNGLCAADTPPFLSYEWLSALETSGCVVPNRGWLPMHITLHQEDRLIAAAPCYVKGNSEGEFVFDHSWARYAYESLGVEYYPKLLVAVPFTPATGPKLLIKPGVDVAIVLEAFARGVEQLCDKLGVSSAHMLFLPGSQAEALVTCGFAHRCGLQYHWRNHGYSSFDEFLGRFSSKRRNQIRRERREVRAGGSCIEVCSGSDITPEVTDFAFEFYSDTVSKFSWGRQYLNRHFFEEVCGSMKDRLHIVLARDQGSSRPIAGAFNLLGSDALYGRYWGSIEERPFLHFETCFYRGIQECIERGLRVFEPGAGGEHKLTRGFEPTITHSMHHLGHLQLARAVHDFVARERLALNAHVEEYRERPVLK